MPQVYNLTLRLSLIKSSHDLVIEFEIHLHSYIGISYCKEGKQNSMYINQIRNSLAIKSKKSGSHTLRFTVIKACL